MMIGQFSNDNAIETPHDNDILSGRGNFVNYHPGNEQFRAFVRKHKVAYVACPKSMKGKFADMIVEEIKQLNPPGRFLKQDDATKLWYNIGDKKALDKTRQALREGAPEIQKEINGEEVAIPTRSEKATERRASTGDIDPSFLEQHLSKERRASHANIPKYTLVDGYVNFEIDDVGMPHSGTAQLQQQISTPHQMQSIMVSHSISQNDPYCSSLPPEHYESFKNVPPMVTPEQAISYNHNMAILNPSLAAHNFENNGFIPDMHNVEVDRFLHVGNPSSSLLTINESNGTRYNADNEYYSQSSHSQQCHELNSSHIGMSSQTEETFQQPTYLLDQNHNNCRSDPHTQWNPAFVNNRSRQNRVISSGSRTCYVRPEPIQLHSYANAQGRLHDVPEKLSSVPSKDFSNTNPKSILRSITPRRMIIDVQHQGPRPVARMDYVVPEVAPLRGGCSVIPEVAPLRGSPPRSDRSRFRGRRDDSTRSVLSANSIAFDSIFADFSDEKSKGGNSGASFLSLMSLSIADDLHTVGETETIHRPIIDSSIKVNSIRSLGTISTMTASLKRVPLRRNGSSDILHVEKGMYEMSVNTISVEDSDDDSSQNDMSYRHVFDERN